MRLWGCGEEVRGQGRLRRAEGGRQSTVSEQHDLCVRVCVCVCVWRAKSLQSCLTLCHPVDYSLPGSSVYGILQARILEWVAMPSSRVSSLPRDRTQVSCGSCVAGRFFTAEPPGKPNIPGAS